MATLDALRERDWATLLGVGLFVALAAGGYYYNVTFVQLGLIDLGVRVVGMTRGEVSVAMAGLALATLAVAIVSGVTMDRRGVSRDLYAKLRILLGVTVLQTALTTVAPFVASELAFYAWVALCSVSIGVGVPATFGLAVDLVPVPDRGYVAALVTAGAFFVAAVYPLEWTIGSFSRVMVAAFVPALLVLGVLASGRVSLVDELAGEPRHARGRFCRPEPMRTWSLGFWALVVLMFGAYFVDSLGFLRIVETESLVLSSWGSPDLGIHLFIGVVHVLGALAAGVLYANFPRRALFLWVFGLFAFTHLLYTFFVRTASGAPPLLMPGFYALAVSFYTTLNFALWPDVSTPDTVGTHAALGVGVAGWLATFLSTSLALYFEESGVGLLSHLNLVNALALLLFAGVPVAVYLHRVARYARGGPA